MFLVGNHRDILQGSGIAGRLKGRLMFSIGKNSQYITRFFGLLAMT